VCVCACACERVNIYVCMDVRAGTKVVVVTSKINVFINTYIYMHLYLHIYTYVYACMSVYLYVQTLK